jgi:hypothetical protein
MDTITITKQEYFELKMADTMLRMLYEGGVDNWSHYSDCFNPSCCESLDELETDLRKEILGEE